MKRILLVSCLALLCAFQTSAQEVKNKLPKNTQEWLDRDWPITDTLAFGFPNEGKMLIYFNNEEYSAEALQEKFEPLLKKSTEFPEFKSVAYRLAEQFSSTKLEHVLLEIEKDYTPYIDQLELTFPVGLDYTGGEFTPEVGFRAKLSWRKFGVGGSITNTVFFPERVDNNIKVNSNWFVNAEFSWDMSDPKSNTKNLIGVGYLLNESKSQLFEGTTMKAFYRRQLNKNIAIQVGVIATENFRTFYPTVGIRFW